MKKTLMFTGLTLVLSTNAVNAQAMRPLQEFYGEGYTIIVETPIENGDLSQIINKPIKAHNIKDGLFQILNGTGWRLAHENALNPRIHNLYSAPWPTRWNFIGPDSLQNVLDAVGGEGWQVVVDPVNRLIGYEVKPQFRGK